MNRPKNAAGAPTEARLDFSKMSTTDLRAMAFGLVASDRDRAEVCTPQQHLVADLLNINADILAECARRLGGMA